MQKETGGGYVLVALFGGFGIFVALNQSNRFNFNRNSAAIAVAMKVLEEVRKEDVCIVFCDRVTKGYDGYRLMKQCVPQNARVLALEALAYGDKLVLAYSDEMEKEQAILQNKLACIGKHYQKQKAEKNVLAVLGKGMVLASGEIRNGEFVVNNTRSKKDVQLDNDRLAKIVIAICSYIHEMERR